MRYSGEPLPTLAALDSARCSGDTPRLGDTVIYLSNFSRRSRPGCAWLGVAYADGAATGDGQPGPDLMTSSLSQEIAAEFMRRGWLPAQVARIRDTYR